MGSDKHNNRGQMLEHFFSEINLCVLNNVSAIYVPLASDFTSLLELPVCSSSLVLDYEWSVHEDLCGNDHFPVMLTSSAEEEEPSTD